MRNFIGLKLASATLGVMAFATVPRTAAIAHEGHHHMKCERASIQAMKADIQAMKDGEAKTMAAKEMAIAEDMMAKKDMTACMTHMSKAMEAMEK
jgi:hypothetical protein